MPELNREDIIKALECCFSNDWNNTKCNECPAYNGGGGCIDELKKSAIALIKDQAEQIFKLENRLKECENGYEGTLFLDRCKLHDAEEKVKQLTEEKREIFEEIKEEITLALNSNYKAKEEHINRSEPYLSHFRDLVDGKICALRGIYDFIDELKKKCIGEKQ